MQTEKTPDPCLRTHPAPSSTTLLGFKLFLLLRPRCFVTRLFVRLLLVVFCIGFATRANAHYLWIAVSQLKDQKSEINIYFEESPRPGDGSYLDHFLGKSKLWVRTLKDPNPKSLDAKEVKENDNRWMQTVVPASDEYSVEAYGQFGVYAYGDTKVLLHYYARNLTVESHDAMHELGNAEHMSLDLIPHDEGQTIEFTLTWKDEPVANRMVFIRGADGFRKNIETDVDGRIEVERPKSGNLTLRSSVEFPTPGELEGEAYELVRHNITLVMPTRKKPDSP